MKTLFVITGLFFACAGHLFAHRTEGLLQASLVEVTPAEVRVEVTLTPGIDVVPKIIALFDTNGDGVVSDAESAAWAAKFMERQSVMVDGRSLLLKPDGVLVSPLEQMTEGHGGILVHFSAPFGDPVSGEHRVLCANRYEPIPGTFQTNGIVPKDPGVRISSHHRDERQQELTLAAEFSGGAVSAAPIFAAAPQNRSPLTAPVMIGMGVAAVFVSMIIWRRSQPVLMKAR